MQSKAAPPRLAMGALTYVLRAQCLHIEGLSHTNAWTADSGQAKWTNERPWNNARELQMVILNTADKQLKQEAEMLCRQVRCR